MPNVQQTHKLSTFKDWATIGQRLVAPSDLEVIEAAVNRLAPGSNVDPTTLLALIVAGAVGARIVTEIDRLIAKAPVPPDHPAGEGPPVPPWATELLASLGLAAAPAPSGPINSREELHARASLAGLVLP